MRGPITPAWPIPLRARANAHFRPPVQRSACACAAPHPRLLPGSADAAPRRRNLARALQAQRNKERAGEGSDYASPAIILAGKTSAHLRPTAEGINQRKSRVQSKNGLHPAFRYRLRLASAASLFAIASAPESRFHSCNQAFPYAGPPSRAFPGRAPVHNQSRAAIRCRCGPTRFAAPAEIHPPR